MAECPLCETEVSLVDVGGIERFAHHGDCSGSFSQRDLVETNLESRYTLPSDLCPHPERWTSEDWDSAELEVTELVAAFVGALRPDLVVETGSAFGQTARAIGYTLKEAGSGVLHTIEPNPERAEITRGECKNLPVVVEEMSSLDFEPPSKIGFAWFDSLVPLRLPEFEHFYPHLLPGAIVGFHDTAPHHGTAMWQGIMAQETAGRLLPIRLHTPRGVVFGEVVK